MPKPRSNRRSKTELAKEYLEARKGHCTNEEVMAAVTCGQSTVVRARHALQRINPAFPPAPGDKLATIKLTPTGVEEIERTLAEARGDSGKPLEDAEKLNMLAVLARRAYQDDNAKLAGDLVTVHTRIRDSTKQESTLGPGPPATPEETLDRTSIILDCVGPEVAAAAVARAFTGTDLATFGTTFDRLKVTAPHSPPHEPRASEAVPPSAERPPNAPDHVDQVG